MRTSQKAESFVWIIVWVFILTFVVLGIVNILTYSIDITTSYNDANRIQVLKQNLTNAVKQMDTSLLQENEVFYIHKNRAANVYELYTGSLNDFYRYVDELWNTISDISTFEGSIYSQILWVTTEDISLWEQNQVIKASITKLARR